MAFQTEVIPKVAQHHGGSKIIKEVRRIGDHISKVITIIGNKEVTMGNSKAITFIREMRVINPGPIKIMISNQRLTSQMMLAIRIKLYQRLSQLLNFLQHRLMDFLRNRRLAMFVIKRYPIRILCACTLDNISIQH